MCCSWRRDGVTRRSQMDLAELLALPVAVDLVTASRALGIARTTGYELAQRGEYPVRTIRMGARYTVPTAEILRALGVTDGSSSVSERFVDAGKSSLTDDLERLAALHQTGALTEAEFSTAKQRMLDMS